LAEAIAMLKTNYLQRQTKDEQNSILSHRPLMYLGIIVENIQDHACDGITETAIF
jgi:hypothetical protein